MIKVARPRALKFGKHTLQSKSANIKKMCIFLNDIEMKNCRKGHVLTLAVPLVESQTAPQPWWYESI